jgi:hypothetical protein
MRGDDPVFVAAEGGVGGVGPGDAVALVVVVVAGHDGGDVASADGAAVAGFVGDMASGGFGAEDFGATAVVGEHEDEGVVELVGFAESAEDAADVLVHAVDHGGVNGHAAHLPFLIGSVFPGGDVGVAWGEGPAFVDDAEFDHAAVTFLAEGVPAVFVAGLVAVDVFFEGVHGPVGRGEGDVAEEGFAGGGGFFDVADGVGADGVGVVEVLALGFDEVVVAGEGSGVVEAAGAVDGAEELVEAALAGPVVFGIGDGGDVPLAGHPSVVATGAHDFGDGDGVGAEVAFVGGELVVLHHVADAGLMGIEAREEGGAGGATAGGVVELGEAEAFLGERVEVGGADLAAVAAEVAEAHVVGHHDDDVGAAGGLCGAGGEGGGEGGGGGGGDELTASKHRFRLYRSGTIMRREGS